MQQELLEQKRNYGIDLLRMVSMIFIVCIHILMQGGVLAAEIHGTMGYYLSNFLYTICMCAVDCFVLISGYVSCKSKFCSNKILELWCQVVFWSIVVSCFFFMICPETRTINEFVSMFFPILRKRYWFFTAYCVMFIFAPILNYIIQTLNKEKFKLLIFAALFIFGCIPVFSLGYDVLDINGGACFSWLVILYLIGGYIRFYLDEMKWDNRWNLLVVLGLASINLIYKMIVEFGTEKILGNPNYGDLWVSHTSPIILGEAVFLFCFFKNLKIEEGTLKSKIIYWITPAVFSVYVIHVHPLVFWNKHVVGVFAPLAELNPIIKIIVIITVGIIVFVGCVLLDSIRRIIFRVFQIKKICKIVAKKIEILVYGVLKIERE